MRCGVGLHPTRTSSAHGRPGSYAIGQAACYASTALAASGPVRHPALSTARYVTSCARRKASAFASSNIAMVEQLPAKMHTGASTLIDCQQETGQPVMGLMM